MEATRPSTTSVPALYLSNWQKLVVIWEASKLAQTDPAIHGPGIRELHFLGGPVTAWTVNQLVDHTGFFRDETSGASYTHVENFESEAWLESDPPKAGLLTTNYLTYAGAAVQPRCRISRSYGAVPNESFLAVRYVLTNTTNHEIVFNILDQVHLDNMAVQDPSKPVHAWYDGPREALVADMTASGQFYIVLGAFPGMAMDGHQAGDDANSVTTSASVGGWYSFDHDGTLKGNSDVTASDVDLAFNKRVTIGAGGSATVDLYLGVALSRPDAEALADRVRGRSADAWFAQTSQAVTSWLHNSGKGKRLKLSDPGLNELFDRLLIVVKNAQNPATGTFTATTNPYAYGYKNWARDATVAAIALDASGHHEEAAQYFQWMASVQGNDGTWRTGYGSWDGHYVSGFVEPEYDSIGTFIFGVYRHYRLTGDSAFLSSLWPSVQKAADWILGNLAPNGFGRADFSIWEEPERGLEHNSYTQAWYVAGLYATQSIAELRGDTNLADWYAGGAASIMTALQRSSTWNPPGMWNPEGYYNRAVNQDNSVQPLVDSSSDLLVALGIIDHESDRAGRHVATIVEDLTSDADPSGIARYEDDDYYYTSKWDPACVRTPAFGSYADPACDEVGAVQPSWPQMSMWVAVCEVLSGEKQRALKRLQWYASTTGKGYMPQGEAVSTVTQQSVLTSMSEPLTACSFVLASLCYSGAYDMRILPPVYNGGAFKPITVSPGAVGDWPQWVDVPYFVGSLDAMPRKPLTTIKRVYVANDDTNLYVRVDNRAGGFPAFKQPPGFALRVYGEDMAHRDVEVIHTGLGNDPIPRPVSRAVARRSDENVFRRWSVEGATWVEGEPVVGVIVPQWDTATGRLEAIVPIAALSSGPVAAESWANLVVSLAYSSADGGWSEDGRVVIHYRLTSGGDAWIYGNIEQ